MIDILGNIPVPKVKQKLLNFEQAIKQSELTVTASKLSDVYTGLTAAQVSEESGELTEIERQVTDCIIELMEAEDNQEHEEPYLDGLHFTLNQPELARNRVLTQTLTELIEQRNLLKNIMPSSLESKGVHVIIGTENDSEAMRDYSVVISQYGLPEEAAGTICVIGPTRMPYARTIATVGYLSAVLSGMVAKLYGKSAPGESETEIID